MLNLSLVFVLIHRKKDIEIMPKEVGERKPILFEILSASLVIMMTYFSYHFQVFPSSSYSILLCP